MPAPVFEEYQRLQRELERGPTDFFTRRVSRWFWGESAQPGRLAEARAALAAFVGARAEDLVFVPNATSGLNAGHPLASLEPGDEILTTAHEYGAVVRTWEFMRREARRLRAGRARREIGPSTRAVSVSHITSPTALVLPVEEICAAARTAQACWRSSTARTRPVTSRSTSRRSVRTSTPGTATSGCARRRAPGSCGRDPSTRAGSSRSSSAGATARRRLRRASRLGGDARSGGLSQRAESDRGARDLRSRGRARARRRRRAAVGRARPPADRRRAGAVHARGRAAAGDRTSSGARCTRSSGWRCPCTNGRGAGSCASRSGRTTTRKTSIASCRRSNGSSDPSALPAEELALELPELGRRELCATEQLDDLVRELSLLRGSAGGWGSQLKRARTFARILVLECVSSSARWCNSRTCSSNVWNCTSSMATTEKRYLSARRVSPNPSS